MMKSLLAWEWQKGLLGSEWVNLNGKAALEALFARKTKAFGAVQIGCDFVMPELRLRRMNKEENTAETQRTFGRRGARAKAQSSPPC